MALRWAYIGLKALVPRRLRPGLRRWYEGLKERWAAWARKRRGRAYMRELRVAAVPPAKLRFRVAGDEDIEGFLRIGKRCCDDIERALARVGRPLESFESLLDFGCGCGRHLLLFAKRPGLPRCYGSDVDEEAIAWCRANLDFATFAVNGELPPLEYPDGAFDLIWAISVFSHLDEDHQDRWLEELRRVARPGAVVLCTVHGEHIWRNLPEELQAKVARDGFLFLRSQDWKGKFPEWYQTAYHTEEYARSRFGRHFRVAEYVPRGLAEHQDVVILRRG